MAGFIILHLIAGFLEPHPSYGIIGSSLLHQILNAKRGSENRRKCYFRVHTGFLFSKNALTPSLASWVEHKRANASFIN